MRTLRYLTVSLLVTCLGSSCVQQQLQPKARTTAALRAFSSPDELRNYLADQVQATVGSSRGGGLFSEFLTPSVALTAAPSQNEGAVADTSGTGNSDSFSTTNIQEEGVDEADIVKNDGQTIFALDGDKIHVIKATPSAEVGEIATIALAFSGDSLYLKDTSLVAISRQYGYYYGGYGGIAVDAVAVKTTESGSGVASQTVVAPSVGSASSPSSSSSSVALPFGGRSQTIVGVYDVSDPAHPVLKATANFEGVLADSRLIDNRLYLVLAATPVLPDNPTPAALKNQDLATWIPDYQVAGGDGGVVSSGDIVGWENVFRPDDPDGYGIVTVVTLDVDQPTAPFTSTSITADAGVIYASKDALYISDTNYSYTTSTVKVDTAIHKLAFTGGGTEYRASGLVPGRPLNQYSLGEYNGNMRIATHIDSTSFPILAESESVSAEGNSVYVLSENAGNASLDIIGRIEGIAPTEQIYAARFVGDRGFLVTFRRVDPLFTLDLADPANPRIAGQLKVPGYSDHIQLLDANHLLTIGKDAQDTGQFAWVQGVQISIFDVSDPANPTLLTKEVIGGRGTSSEANYNPKAFNYFASKNVLAFPVDVYSGHTTGPQTGTHDFSGLYVYRVTVADGFQLLGRISSDGGSNSQGCFLGYYGYTRGVFIGDDVYSVTQRGVKTAALAAVGTLLGQTTFAGAAPLYPDCYPYYPTILLPTGSGLE